MLTALEPEYEFEDGTAFVVGDYKNVRSGDKIAVYVPSAMSEIGRSDYKEVSVDFVNSVNMIFANVASSAPVAATSVNKINFLTATVGDSLVKDRANEELYNKYRKDPEHTSAIHYIPFSASLKAGESVSIGSTLGTLKDIAIYV